MNFVASPHAVDLMGGAMRPVVGQIYTYRGMKESKNERRKRDGREEKRNDDRSEIGVKEGNESAVEKERRTRRSWRVYRR